MTDNQKKLTPNIRFKGFSDAWEQRKLGEFALVAGGGTPSSDKSSYWNGNINWYTPTELGSVKYLRRSERQISKEGFNNSSAKILPIGSVLFTSRASIGDVGIICTPATTNQGFQSLIPQDTSDSEFLYYLGQRLKITALKLASGSTFKEISSTSMKNIKIYIPFSTKERIQIGGLLKFLDDVITINQRKLDQLKQFKKLFMQKIFSQEWRFKGFTDPWEQRKLANIFCIIDGDRGKNYPHESDFKSSGNVLFLDTGNVRKSGFNFESKKFISDKKNHQLRNGILEPADFVITSRGTLGNVAYYDNSVQKKFPIIRINSAMLILRTKKDNTFSHDLLKNILRSNTLKDFFTIDHVGSAQPHITKRDFSKVKIEIPTKISEQKQIGFLLNDVSKLVTLNQQKLNQLQQLKKYLMQNMFV
mgnify:CR=1 FL=1